MSPARLSALLRTSAGAILLLGLPGCSGGSFDAWLPTVRFDRLDLTSLDFEQIGVDFVFDVDNPNPVGVPIDRFAYALGFEGIELISGNDADGLRLAADGTSEVALPISLSFDGIFDVAEATRGLDVIGFNLAGGFGFDTDVGPVDIAYDEAGDFPALRAPKIDFGDLLVQSYDDEEVNFGLNLNVDNEHGSNMDLSELDFTMKFAGVRVGRGQMAEVGTAAAASTTTMQIPFTVSYEDAYDAFEAAYNGERLNMEMVADVTVNTPFGLVPLAIDQAGNVNVREE